MAKFHQNDGSQFASHGEGLPLDSIGNGSAGINLDTLKPGKSMSTKIQSPAQHAAVRKAAAVSVAHRQSGAKRPAGASGFKMPKLPGMLGG
jgi:hypothetical protein